ncbi:phospholipase D family protein [Euzebyella saccharophila]|uniref:Phospholipase D family protein n=1 Tax=Euzebyella saccharophila TaxID=679664 RepID=A0ABV8JNZ8_9FLAO|nr:phospholipase D family protein [Euzebyella saccharophila]
MGTGAGTKLLKEIGNAQRSVKISSPYLSPKMVDELVWLHKKGIKVTLITSDKFDIRSYRQERSIQPLVVQNRHLDESANRIRNRWLFTQKVLIVGSIVLTLFLVVLSIFSYDSAYIYGLGIALLLFLCSRYARRKTKHIKIYLYTYSSLFPFKVFVAPDSYQINDMFIHGKIYIIDGHTAYLGSLNFTESGTKYNYETRIRVTDTEAVRKIEEEFDALYDHPDLAFFGLEQLGKSIFKESFNQSSSELRVTFS